MASDSERNVTLFGSLLPKASRKIVQVTFSSAFLCLEQLAIADAPDAAHARGCCLDAAVQLGREALRLGYAKRVTFVRWHVLDDPQFVEHWALALDDGRVIDPTAAQVDGDSRPLRCMDEYPANFTRPRRYPVEGLVPMLAAPEAARGWRYTRGQMWALHRWIFAHDARAAVRRRSMRDLADATRAVARSALTLTLEAALERAVNRAARLQARRSR